MSAIPLSSLAASGRWQEDFLRVEPAVREHARIRFRRLRPDQKEEAVAETVAAACVSYAHLASQGKLGRAFTTSLADFAVRHTALGRHVGGSQSSSDVTSPLARKRHGFSLHYLSPGHDYHGLRPLVTERRAYSPADVAAFRIDFSEWLTGFPRRDRRIIGRMIAGDGTFAVADRFGVTPGRVSQLRRKYELSWRVFQREALLN